MARGVNTALPVFVFVLGLATPAIAGVAEDVRDAEAAQARGDYATELRLLRPLAERGSAIAQKVVAGLYFNGQGVPQDYAEAMKWYLKAADQGDPAAEFIIGGMYRNGMGVPKDEVEAAKWNLKAADQGDADAQNLAGLACALGHGVKVDMVEAYKWEYLAVERTPPGKARDSRINTRDNIAGLLSATDLAEAQRLAREWKAK